jgi:hypothetical protein
VRERERERERQRERERDGMGWGKVNFSTLPQIFHGAVKLQMFLNVISVAYRGGGLNPPEILKF